MPIGHAIDDAIFTLTEPLRRRLGPWRVAAIEAWLQADRPGWAWRVSLPLRIELYWRIGGFVRNPYMTLLPWKLDEVVAEAIARKRRHGRQTSFDHPRFWRRFFQQSSELGFIGRPPGYEDWVPPMYGEPD